MLRYKLIVQAAQLDEIYAASARNKMQAYVTSSRYLMHDAHQDTRAQIYVRDANLCHYVTVYTIGCMTMLHVANQCYRTR